MKKSVFITFSVVAFFTSVELKVTKWCSKERCTYSCYRDECSRIEAVADLTEFNRNSERKGELDDPDVEGTPYFLFFTTGFLATYWGLMAIETVGETTWNSYSADVHMDNVAEDDQDSCLVS